MLNFFFKASLTKLVAPFIFESEHPILDGGGRSRKMKMESLETFFNFYGVKLYVKDMIGRFKSFCAIISQRLRDIFCPGLAPRSDWLVMSSTQHPVSGTRYLRMSDLTQINIGEHYVFVDSRWLNFWFFSTSQHILSRKKGREDTLWPR